MPVHRGSSGRTDHLRLSLLGTCSGRMMRGVQIGQWDGLARAGRGEFHVQARPPAARRYARQMTAGEIEYVIVETGLRGARSWGSSRSIGGRGGRRGRTVGIGPRRLVGVGVVEAQHPRASGVLLCRGRLRSGRSLRLMTSNRHREVAWEREPRSASSVADAPSRSAVAASVPSDADWSVEQQSVAVPSRQRGHRRPL